MRPHVLCPLLVFVLPLLAFGQPIAPTREAVQALGSAERRIASADAVALSVNTGSREEVRQFYKAIYSASEGVSMGWTGSYQAGTAGDTSAAFKEATRLRINFYRALAGIPAAVTLNDTYNAKAQAAAMMMSGNGTLQHTEIPTTWRFYSAGGAEAAANSNLALGSTGPDSINGYMLDPGASNAGVGHRRWLLYPQTRQMGVGDVPGDATYNAANAVWVIDPFYFSSRPATRTPEVAYPPAGYVPYPLVFARWSFSYPGADFSTSTVTMTRGGQAVPVTLEPLAGNIGEPTLVWVFNGMDTNTQATHPKPTQDTTYSVTVDNVRINGSPRTFTYQVTVFDPDVAGNDAMAVSVTGPTTIPVGSPTSFSITAPAFGSGFDWRTLQLNAFAKTYGAENGLDGIAANTSAGYDVAQTSVRGIGTASFHLAHPTPPTEQTLTLPETFVVTADAAAVSFLSRLGWASPTQVARVQVSEDDGTAWTDVYAQAGTGSAGEGAFLARTVSLAAFKGRAIRVRFAYTTSAAYFPQTTAGVGWYLDSITLTGVQSATVGAQARVATGSTFAATPSGAGTLVLQARSLLFGTYPLAWGPVLEVTASGTAPVNTSFLSNLSVRTKAGSADQTLIAGFAFAGGGKQLLIRGVGPTLAPLGVAGAISDPLLALYAGQTRIDENDNWRTADSAVFDAVYAFQLPAGSKDAALVRTLDPGSYTAQVTGVGGTTGVALVELYDVTGASGGARLMNVSARAQVGTHSEVLIAGFVIGGAGQRRLLIRAVGPTLAAIGVAGALANPKLELYSGDTKITENDNWGGATAIETAARAVYAFDLSPTSLDAALLVDLAPGGYTAKVTGVGDTTGVALVEVYDVR